MKKINNKENLNNINIRLRQFPLINSLYKKVRSFKTPLKKSSNRKSNSLNRIIIAIIVVFITGFVIFNIKHYFDIKPNPYFVNDESSKNRVIYSVDSEFNTIFLGFDDRKNDYRFLDMIVINSLDIKKGIMKTYGINPYILVNLSDYKDFSLRSLLNNLEINDSQKMNILMKAIENIIGIRIDRYV